MSLKRLSIRKFASKIFMIYFVRFRNHIFITKEYENTERYEKLFNPEKMSKTPKGYEKNI